MGTALFAVFLVLYVAWPLIPNQLGLDSTLLSSNTELIHERAITSIAGLWFFAFGATIGSFLNVVAHRMPAGMNFVSKPSRCPYCETPILSKHNVPIVGWLVLRGRCKACRLPISPRYIVVEVLVGLMFFTLLCAELASGGRNLPVREPNPLQGVAWNLITPQWDLIGLYSLHAFLLSALATIALIKLDRMRVPIRLTLFVACVGIVSRVLWPELGVAPPLEQPVVVPQRIQPLLDLAIGVTIAGLAQAVVKAARGELPSGTPFFTTFPLVAVYLGWQALIPAFAIAALLQLMTAFMTRKYDPWDLWPSRLCALNILTATWLTICFWRQLPIIGLPGATSGALFHVFGAVIALSAIFVAENLANPD